jgi:glucosylceramidase
MLFKKRDARGGRRRVGLTAIGAGVVLVLVLSLTRPVVAWADSGPIQVYLTTKDLSVTLQRQADVSFGSKTSSADPRITVSPDTNRQKMVAGFGVAMTDTSAFLINGLPAGARDALMQALFSRAGDGIGLSFLRVPIGGTDFVVGSKPYTYDDNPPGGSDPTLSNFSIAHDQPYILPVINQALALNPQMKVMANAWTPPAWMKTDNKLVTTTGPLGTLKSQYYPVYAQYLVKFIQAYQAAGVHTDYLGVQNEPNTPLVFVAGIPESYLSAPDEGRLVRDQVAPALAAASLSPAVIAWG